MPGGETEQWPSGWTVDTLNAHMQHQLNELRVRATEDMAAVHREIDIAKLAGLTAITAMRAQLDERAAAQTVAGDKAFEAQETAMRTALAGAERAVAAALLSAKEAVDKAEQANSKRFDAMNEFRAQLSDQAQTFMPRLEAEAAIHRNSERIVELNEIASRHVLRAEHDALNDRVSALDRIIASGIGVDSGQSKQANISRANLTIVLTMAGLVLAAVAFVVGAVIK